MGNEVEIRAITEFFTSDSDNDHFCGVGFGATLDDIKRRFGDNVSVMSHRMLSVRGREVAATEVKQASQVVLGATTYTRYVEVFLPDSREGAFPYVDVRLVRQGHVRTELKAAVAALKVFFTALYGPSLRFSRGGAPGEMWIESFGVSKANPAVGLVPSAGLRVRSSPRR